MEIPECIIESGKVGIPTTEWSYCPDQIKIYSKYIQLNTLADKWVTPTVFCKTQRRDKKL